MTFRVKKNYRFFLWFLRGKTDDLFTSFLYSRDYLSLFISFESMMRRIGFKMRKKGAFSAQKTSAFP